MSNRYWATGLIGGAPGALDALNPLDMDGSATLLADGDTCDVLEDEMISIYVAVDSAGASESSPDVIIPDTNPSNWWWQLIERIPQDESVMTALAYANTPGVF